MTASVEKHDTFLSLNLQEILKSFFLYSIWEGNIFIDVASLLKIPRGQT